MDFETQTGPENQTKVVNIRKILALKNLEMGMGVIK